MAQRGASLARTKLLMRLDRSGALRATEIADVFQLSPRTVTVSIDGLEREGLVRREPDGHDRRVKWISITDEGRRVIAETEPLRLKLVDQIFGELTNEERDQFSGILAKLADRLDEVEPKPAPGSHAR